MNVQMPHIHYNEMNTLWRGWKVNLHISNSCSTTFNINTVLMRKDIR